MAYSDDSSNNSLENDGEVFGSADMVGTSPTTSERAVDTQSGYLVVLRKADNSRVTLSVKRRLGTPPGSTILLTPDEQVQLANILSDAKAFTTVGAATRVPPQAEDWMERNGKRVGGDVSLFTEDPDKEFARVSAERLEDLRAMRPQIREGGRRRQFLENKPQAAAVALVLLVLPFIGMTAFNKVSHNSGGIKETRQAESVAAKMEETKIDGFARSFVSDMLDFKPSSYRESQIHAMAVMSPALLERYWKETNFPLSAEQLKNAPTDQTVMITKVTQTPGPEQKTNVDLFAELSSANGKTSKPIHLQLVVGYGIENELTVFDQKDLTAQQQPASSKPN